MTRWDEIPPERPARFDPNAQTLWVSQPWGILCLDAAPVRVRVLDLRGEGPPGWTENLVRLNLRKYLRFVRSVFPVTGRRDTEWWDFAGTRRCGPVEPCRMAAAEAWKDFFERVGIGLCETVARYPSAIQSGMLWLASRVPRLAGLATTNPGLFAALAGRCLRRGLPTEADLERLRCECEAGEQQIAERLGFRPDCWRVLARVHPRAALPGRLARLRRALESPRVRRVARHLPRLGASTLVLLSRAELFARIQPKLFHELAESSLDLARPALAQRLEVLLGTERFCGPGPLFSSLGSLGQLQCVCENWFWGESRDWGLLSRLTFPSPPVADEPGLIEAIRTPAGLLAESITMGNCIQRYVDRVLVGENYAYKTLGRFGLQRATVLAAPHETPGGAVVWHIEEARTSHNRHCSLPTRQALWAFFSDRQRVAEEEVRPRPEPNAPLMD